jgi:dipeptidyl aminopeptidase/acylaminoacyl peptidase
MLTLLCSCVSLAGASEHPSMSELMSSIDSATDYQEVAISPDHRYVAWVQSTSSGDSASAATKVFLQALDQRSPPVQLSAKTVQTGPATSAAEDSIAWSPDSRSLVLLSDADSPGQRELYSIRLADRTVRRLTQLTGNLATPKWAPDGKKIALLYTPNANRQLGPLAAVPAAVGVIDEQVFEQGLLIVDVATMSTSLITARDRYVYEYDWSPHGHEIVATGAHGSGDNNWYVAELLKINVDTRSEVSLLRPSMQIAAPRWAPDGHSIAFLGGLMSDESIASGDIYEIPSGGGVAVNRTPGLEGSAFSLDWRTDSSTIIFAEAVDGGSGIGELEPRKNTVKLLWRGAETVRASRDLAFGLALAADGKTSAVIRESFNEPPAVWSGPIGRWRRMTTASVGSVARWGRAESIEWRSDEFSVQGWLVPPPRIEPGRKYPMVVWIHGGPAWLTAPSWPALPKSNRGLFLASEGYFVFFPNARGSTGFGERFTRANVQDVGAGPLRDILAGVREAVTTHPIDDQRIGITGWSYGGYMTMWALTQTTRFRAAVAGAGVADWLSYYGENGIDEGLIPYFGQTVYDAPELYAKSSPINFIKHVQTPTLIVVGDSDVECPAPQSYEYWHALKSLHVKTELVVYPHEGHEFSDPAHITDLIERMASWFDANMPPG